MTTSIKLKNRACFLSQNVWERQGRQLNQASLSPCPSSTGKEKVVPQSHQIYINHNDESSGDTTWSSKKFPFALLWVALFPFGKKEEAEEEDELILHLKWARLSMHRGDLGKAEHFYHKALEVLSNRARNNEWDEPRVVQAQVYIYDSMANLALATGQLDKSEKLFKETMKGLLQSGSGRDDDAMIEISLKLAMIYAMQRRNKDAEDGYEYCIKTQETKLLSGEKEPDENSLALLGMCVNSYSRFLMVQNRIQESLDCMLRALDIAMRVFGENHSQVAVLCNDVATLYYGLGEGEKAKEYAHRSIRVGKEAESDELAAYYCNCGVIYGGLGEFKEAIKYCTEAVTLARKSKDKQAEEEAMLCIKDVKDKRKKTT